METNSNELKKAGKDFDKALLVGMVALSVFTLAWAAFHMMFGFPFGKWL